VTTLVLDGEGKVAHSELSLHGGALGVGGEWEGAIVGPARMRSPQTVEGINTQFIRVHVPEGLDAHCERARAAGAVITDAPTDQFYGERTYRALDPEGHLWNFAMTVAAFDADAMHEKMGLRLVDKLPEDAS
jgi:uncharacterized glyoxalase superfamily protein PhnB